MDIGYLSDHTDAIPMIARWFYNEWSHMIPNRTLPDVERALAERTNTDRIPLTLVAVEAGSVIGTVGLREHDMDTRMDLTPWLAGMYVASERRRLGIGRTLVHAIEAKASELGIDRLYLYTPAAEAFYRGLGWTTMEQMTYRGYPVSLMTKAITP